MKSTIIKMVTFTIILNFVGITLNYVVVNLFIKLNYLQLIFDYLMNTEWKSINKQRYNIYVLLYHHVGFVLFF